MTIKEKILADLGIEGIEPSDISAVPENFEGDYAVPCFKLSKLMRKAPAAIAAEICSSNEPKGIIAGLIPAGPYVNIVLDKAAAAKQVFGTAKTEGFGSSSEWAGKTVCIDYSSITLSKHMHIGHLCTTVIGESLARLFENAGAKVVRINYLGDMGTPFGKILTMYKKTGSKELIEKDGVDEIQRLYARFAVMEKDDPSLIEEAREWSLKIEEGDKEANELCDWFKTIALNEAKDIYRMLGIDFDDWRGEAFYSDKTDEVIAMLQDKGLLVESDGCQCVDLGAFDMGMCLIRRSDGGSLYTTRDLAAAMDRYNLYKFDKSLYVTGIEQNHHFASFFKVLELAGFEWAKDLKHVGYGRLSTQFGKISGREGNTPVMRDVFNASIEKAAESLRDKSIADDIAVDIGTGAVVFSVLKTELIKDSVFSLEQAISFEGNSSVYVQYSLVRLNTVLEKGGYDPSAEVRPELLTEPEALDLMLIIDRLPEALAAALKDYETSYVTRYSLDLAAAINKYYTNVRIITDNKELTSARLALCALARDVLAKAMYVIGIKAIEKM